VQDLRKQLDELREQMSKLQTRLGELESKASEAATARQPRPTSSREPFKVASLWLKLPFQAGGGSYRNLHNILGGWRCGSPFR